MKTTEETSRQDKRTVGLYSFVGSLLMHSLLFIFLFFVISRLPKSGSSLGEHSTESVGIVFSGGSGTTANQKETENSQNDKEQKKKSAMDLLPAFEQDHPVLEELLPKQNILGMNNDTATSSSENTSQIRHVVVSDNDSDSHHGQGHSTDGGHGTDGGHAGQTVTFGDIKGNGRKFVYVLDRSESMRWSNEWPMRYALREAKSSIGSLDRASGALRFQLVYYNHEARAFDKGRLLDVNTENKKKVIQFLDSIFPEGGTDPLAAIDIAVKMAPDVIFFLTDADEEITPMALAKIHEMAKKAGVRQIHVVEFGKSNAVKKKSFRQLAYDNNGQYIFKRID